MSPINKEKQEIITGKIAHAVSKVLDSPELNELSYEQIETIAKSVYADTLKEKFSKEVKKATLNDEAVQEYVNQWLNGFSSKHTKRSFKKNIDLFLSWLNGKSLVDVNANVADQYASFLINDKSISDNTKRQRIAACSSFFSIIERWEVVPKNPFKGIKGLPRKRITIKQADSIPSNEELDILEKYVIREIDTATGKGSTNKKRGNTLALCALKVLRATGLRIGALQNIVIDANGHYKAKSKGSIAQGRLEKSFLDTLEDWGLSIKKPFESYTANNFSVWLHRILSTQELSEKIPHKFSPHTIRHRFSIDFYIRTKDIHALSKRLGHSSLLVTTAYLSGLESEIMQE